MFDLLNLILEKLVFFIILNVHIVVSERLKLPNIQLTLSSHVHLMFSLLAKVQQKKQSSTLPLTVNQLESISCTCVDIYSINV